MLHSPLRKVAQSEPSRRGAGTWRRQVQLQAAPRCRRVRVQHESTRIHNREQWPGRTCRPRATRWSDEPASPARRHGRPASTAVQIRNSTKRRAALNGQAHNTAHRPAGLYFKERTRQGRKLLEKGAAKKTWKKTTALPPSPRRSPNAHNWRCFSARSQKWSFS